MGERCPAAVASAALGVSLGARREEPTGVGKRWRAPMVGIWSARRGTYRVLYRIDDANHAVIVETIRHRHSAYR